MKYSEVWEKSIIKEFIMQTTTMVSLSEYVKSFVNFPSPVHWALSSEIADLKSPSPEQGDLSKPDVKNAKEDAFKQAVDWFKQSL